LLFTCSFCLPGFGRKSLKLMTGNCPEDYSYRKRGQNGYNFCDKSVENIQDSSKTGRFKKCGSFLYSPEVVFLDEPTIGLDLSSQAAIRKFLRGYSKERKITVIITSHNMDDIEETCDRVILLSKGNKVFDGTIGEMSWLYSSEKVLQLVFDKQVDPDEFAKYGEITEALSVEILSRFSSVNRVFFFLLSFSFSVHTTFTTSFLSSGLVR